MKKLIAVLVLLAVCFSTYASESAKPYNEKLDKISSGLCYATITSPVLTLSKSNDQNITTATMYAETMALTYGTKELLKHFIEKDRPYTFFEGAPEKDKEEWKESFPSGHTAIAFASAAFTTYVFAKNNPDSNLKLPVALATGAAAITTAVLRVQSGCHYCSDVVVGALIGTAIGLAVPMLHTINSGETNSPFSLAFSFNF